MSRLGIRSACSTVLLWLVLFPLGASGQTVTAYVAGDLITPNADGTVTLSSSTTDARTHGCITISALASNINGGMATISAVNLGPDNITLLNAKITGNSAGCLAEITAWATFTQPPLTAPTSGGNPENGIRFVRSITAEAQRYGGAATASGSAMWASGWVVTKIGRAHV